MSLSILNIPNSRYTHSDFSSLWGTHSVCLIMTSTPNVCLLDYFAKHNITAFQAWTLRRWALHSLYPEISHPEVASWIYCSWLVGMPCWTFQMLRSPHKLSPLSFVSVPSWFFWFGRTMLRPDDFSCQRRLQICGVWFNQPRKRDVEWACYWLYHAKRDPKALSCLFRIALLQICNQHCAVKQFHARVLTLLLFSVFHLWHQIARTCHKLSWCPVAKRLH